MGAAVRLGAPTKASRQNTTTIAKTSIDNALPAATAFVFCGDGGRARNALGAPVVVPS